MANSSMLDYKSVLRTFHRGFLKFQIMSDLHLEVGNQYETFQVPVESPFLILGGDIGRLRDYESYLSFLAMQCAQFDTVYLVLGNHEFYGISRSEGLALADKLEKEERTLGKLKLLHRRRLDNRDEIERRVNDFRQIQGWNVDEHNEEHERDVDWLRTEINLIRPGLGGAGNAKSILVVTHHAPVRKGSSDPMYDESPLADAFSTDLIGVHEQLGRVQWWVFGHTHYTTQWREQGVNLISNQRGYVFGPGPNGQHSSSTKGNDALQFVRSYFKRKDCQFDPRKCIQIKA
ncbi:hypothetical protein G647_07260 [Cladophialophora carrionii CBS 160.54]|uniref:Calcineurin-like phosphoesterase domain-containing protein n=1 Tax=Cladophialophora carrionii CBS 160.54 TaxID=1279043 RepID=V9D4L3_9EURO|nr:uncharacterized protein G647_07260 [Cladophialophora carrionii CBS 160.54]ETI20917.1 hypothetical protein G647_07260 [Cladophialophora carrionii CBS 160.54]